MSWQKIECFYSSIDEKYLFAGNASGEVLEIDTSRFVVTNRIQAHSGMISAIAGHCALPYFATRARGWQVILWKQDRHYGLKKLFEIDVRDIPCSNYEVLYTSMEDGNQALAFHSTDSKLIARTGKDGLLEIEFDELGYCILRSTHIDENFPIITACYLKNSNKILCGSSHGRVVLVENGVILNKWKLADEDIHWFEYVERDIYLVASDSRRVIRLDISGHVAPIVGSPFARDDFEHITYSSTIGKAFASSFDRNIYEIDPLTCEPVRTLWQAPHKCRWLHVLNVSTNILIIQCRNGALYKVDALKSKLLAEIRETPNAIWTATKSADGKVYAAGEGNSFVEFAPQYTANAHCRFTSFHGCKVNLGTLSTSYTKRIAISKKFNLIAFGRTDGEILIYENGASQILLKLEAAVRDLVFDSQALFLYIACEDGKLVKVSLSEKKISKMWQTELPIWALALNEEKNVLAVAERMGNLILFDMEMLQPLQYKNNVRYCKRMKWANSNILLYSSHEGIHKYDITKAKSFPYVAGTGNSVEDFIWDPDNRYLVLINYNRKIMLYDFSTGQILDKIHDQMDFSKGMMWIDSDINKSNYPYEFITFGRMGSFCFYQIYENCIISNGRSSCQL